MARRRLVRLATPIGQVCPCFYLKADVRFEMRMRNAVLARKAMGVDPAESRERGAAVAEFGIVVVILVSFIYGIVEFSSAWNYRTQLNNEAIVGARQYATSYDVSNPVADHAARQAAISRIETSMSLPPGAVQITGNCTLVGVSPSGVITTTITVSRSMITSYFDGVLGGPLTLTGRGVAPCA